MFENKKKKIMEPLRFERIKIEKVYFPEFLCKEFKNSRYPMPNNIVKARNMAIILGFVEFFCCFLSFFLYSRRRSRIILAFLLINILASCIGFYSKLKLSYCGLLFHSSYTISVIGGVYIYIIIDYFLTSDYKQSSDKG